MNVTAIIETPKGSTEKYDFDPAMHLFKLKKILPAGMSFPYDFGFIPDTKGEDGDSLDIIVLSEVCAFPGCVMECRLIGAILANQTERDGKTIRNDRFIGIPVVSKQYEKIKNIDQLPGDMLNELKSFFINYNELAGKKFKPLKTIKGREALKLIQGNG